jgi:hypothetical protein
MAPKHLSAALLAVFVLLLALVLPLLAGDPDMLQNFWSPTTSSSKALTYVNIRLYLVGFIPWRDTDLHMCPFRLINE